MALTLSYVENVANELIAFHQLNGNISSDWKFKWNRRSQAIGLCSYKDSTIQLSDKWASVLSEVELRDTILHEIAHAMTPGDGHGTKWRMACVQIGANPKRLVDVPKDAVQEIKKKTVKYFIVYKSDSGIEKVGYRERIKVSLYGRSIFNRPETKGKLFYVEADKFDRPDVEKFLFKGNPVL